MENTGVDDAGVLRNLAHHLRELATDVGHVAQAVSGVTAAIRTPPACLDIQNLQKIDGLYQSLTDLADLSDALACSPSTRAPALSALKLDTTRALLTEGVHRVPDEPGSIDLF